MYRYRAYLGGTHNGIGSVGVRQVDFGSHLAAVHKFPAIARRDLLRLALDDVGNTFTIVVKDIKGNEFEIGFLGGAIVSVLTLLIKAIRGK